MNYRHHYHAGNFADVAKHAIVLALVAGMQRKEKGFLFLDTHAGRGAYDLAAASQGDSLQRAPEWPMGWGRVEAAWRENAAKVPTLLRDYAAAVSGFAQRQVESAPTEQSDSFKPYPGSPVLVVDRLREQDRAVLCELQGGEADGLRENLGPRRRVQVEQRDGYEAVRGCLPPLERRALVLIDPPYEAENEARKVMTALREGLRRLPGGTFAVWYPLTARAGAPTFLAAVEKEADWAPTWTAELTVAGPEAGLKMRGAGVMVVNPPWQLDQAVAPAMTWLGETLAQAAGGEGSLRWLVPER
ncbi:23S rRNA (adenine(2030)-N(6))-methyltransferase RlmJ [Actomonas aquatica]|uniref:Ribosomal RNA large subunit methyltransferase J n=1 Tax=Actomonas aquatica TaxID=2866162 RepID=A0ABZ1CEU1_9BACT|nr:23S rRNA (adenine(2030)-N(6))-methyltransferase RlmJ [Opitutus sp. WL0086]WRQ88800.1 23S rRNA (adenine(2030)-N(6))-methyltransferase RlmJ [Opitutus sp. WL0086]